MPRLVRHEALADRRHLIVMLRLVANTDGGLVYGELVDVETGSMSRFADWSGLPRVVRAWLSDAIRRQAGSAADQSTDAAADQG